MEYKIVPIDSVVPHPKNYNFHPNYQVVQLGKSVDTFGQVKNIVIHRGRIIAGEGFWRGMVKAGQTHISVKDVSEWPEEKALAYMAADNELARLAEPDLGKLAENLKWINTANVEWAELAAGDVKRLKELTVPSRDAEPNFDRAEELQEKWQVKTGDLWRIGEHCLLCGDSTKREDVERVMQGEMALFCFTDPPYNVGVAYGDATNDGRSKSDFVAWCKLWSAHLPKRVCLTVGIKRLLWWDEILGDPQWIIAWVKRNGQGQTGFGGTNKWDAILCYGISPDHKTDLIELNNDYSESIKSDGGHPTAKPVELWAQLIDRFSEVGSIVFEPFVGTGTALIACENTKRIGRGVEIEPKYCALTIDRMATAFPDLAIERLEAV